MRRTLLVPLLALALTGCAAEERTAAEAEESEARASLGANLLGCPADCLGRRLERKSPGSAAAVDCKAAVSPGLYACSSLVAYPSRPPDCRLWTLREPAIVLSSHRSACPIRTLFHGLSVRTA